MRRFVAPLPLALLLAAATFGTAALATPYRGEWPDLRPAWWPRERIVRVYVCNPPKDQARVVPGMLMPKFVKPEYYTATDVTPAAQAREGKRKVLRR